MRSLLAFLLTAVPCGAADLVFEGGGERMVVPGERLVGVTASLDYNGRDVVEFAFGPEDTKAFHQLTQKLLGEYLDVSVCGEVLVSPMILEPIEGGRGIISASSRDMAVDLAERLQGDAACPAPTGS